MGHALVRAAGELATVQIAAAVASAASRSLGHDAGVLAGMEPLGVQVMSDLTAALGAADVAVDFSQPQATRANIIACRAARKPLLIGTTGFPAELIEPELEAAASEIPVLVAPNTSLGVALLAQLVRRAARALPAEFDVEIIEAHHRLKRDAPSGGGRGARPGARGSGLGQLRRAERTAAAGRDRVRRRPRRRYRRGAHGALCWFRGGAAPEPPGGRPADLRARGAPGGTLAAGPAAGPLRYERYCRCRS
jgi:4-hydroxy-tetrahydrodipicolinate reductase